MINIKKMKFYLLLFFYLHFTVSVFAQSNNVTHFQDLYQLSQNIKKNNLQLTAQAGIDFKLAYGISVAFDVNRNDSAFFQLVDNLKKYPAKNLLQNATVMLLEGSLYANQNDIASDSLYAKALILFEKQNDLSGQMVTISNLLNKVVAEPEKASSFTTSCFKKSENLYDKIDYLPIKLLGFKNKLDFAENTNTPKGIFYIDSLYNYFLKTFSSEKNNEDVYYGTVNAFVLKYFYAGQLQKSITLMKLAVTNSKNTVNNFTAFYNLGVLYSQSGDYKNALQSFKEALARFGTKTSEYQLVIHYRTLKSIAMAFKKINQYDSAYYYSMKAMDKQEELNIFQLNQKRIFADKQLEVTLKQVEIEKLAISVKSAQAKSLLLYGGVILLAVFSLSLLYLFQKGRKTNRAIADLAQNRQQLIQTITHDLSTPLNNCQQITDAVAYLIDQKKYDELPKITADLEITGIALRNTLNNLLRWAETRKNRRYLNKKELSLHHLVNDVLSVYLPLTPHKNITVEKKFSILPTIVTDEEMVAQLLRNIFYNAVKHATHNTNIFFEIKQSQNLLEIMVCNTASDRKIAILQSIFDTYFYNNRAGMSTNEHVSFGFILIKESLELLKGKINLLPPQSPYNVRVSLQIPL